jgi:hypothetical protein
VRAERAKLASLNARGATWLELYRDYGVGRTLAHARVAPGERTAARSPNLAQAIGAWKRLRETTAGHRAGR